MDTDKVKVEKIEEEKLDKVQGGSITLAVAAIIGFLGAGIGMGVGTALGNKKK